MMLPPLQQIEFDELEDRSPEGAAGFLKLRRRKLQLLWPDGSRSAPFVFDNVDRNALDAVVIAAHYQADGERHVYLRSAIRPATHMRPVAQRPLPEAATLGSLWELPAGLLEADEVSAAGLRRCAARELHEELGFELTADQFQPLGPASFPAPGIIGERHHFFHATVSPAARSLPLEDGSVLEQRAQIHALPLSEALALVRTGRIEDGKTELALRRLAEL